ncbi:MAG: ABC transporter permease subunit [Pirellulaceae bacterium]
MNKALWKKCLSESAILFVAIALGTAAFAWFRVHVVGEVDTTSFQKILDLLPQEWLNFTSVDVEWLISYVGRTAMTLDEPFLVMMIAMWAIVRGSDVVSGEISRGTMEMLLAQPVSRGKVFVTHSVVTLLGVIALVGVTWLGMWVAVHTTNVKVAAETQPSAFEQLMVPFTMMQGGNKEIETVEKPMSEFVDARLFWPGLFNLVLLGFFVAGVATLMSSMDRYRWRTLGIVVAIYMGAAMIKILAMSAESFGWVGWLTFFSLYEPELSIKLYQADSSAFWQFNLTDEEDNWKGFGQAAHNLILVISTSVLFAVAYRIFKRRDIPAPL